MEGNAKLSGGGSITIPAYVLNGGSGSGSGSGSDSDSSSDDDDSDNWFTLAYKQWKHLIEMDQAETADFLNWLQEAWPQAYAEGLFELDDAYGYAEEVYDGLHDLVNDYISDEEFAIDKLEEEGAATADLIPKWQALADYIKGQIYAAYASGLDDTDDYVQNLWQSYWSTIQNITDANEDAEDDAKDALDDLVEYRMKMIKQDYSNQKEALKDQLSDLKDFVDKQKELL